MGLLIVVGARSAAASWADTDEIDAELAALAAALERNGYPAHREPPLPAADVLELEAWSYTGLHRLRRLAARSAVSGQLPEPGDERASEDPVLLRMYGRWPPDGHEGPADDPVPYEHLLMHHDASGWYVPAAFERVLFGPPDRVPGGAVGSSPRLLAECERLAGLLEVPPELHHDHPVLQAALDEGPRTDPAPTWRRYPVETLTCLQLLTAAGHSCRTGAALLFY